MAHFAFDPNDLHRLSRLAFLPRASSNDAERGVRRSRRAGDGADFLDFREYTAGDDVRRVDWNVFGRTKQLFVRLNESPRQLGVTLLVDSSRSMGFGTPTTKLEMAQRLACGLGFVALRGGDRVRVYGFTDTPGQPSAALVGVRGLATLVRRLQSLEAGGKSDLLSAVAAVRRDGAGRGAVVVISDFLGSDGRDAAIRQLRAGGATVLLVQVLDALDRGVGLVGKLRLRDSESGRMVDVDLDAARVEKFAAAFEAERTAFVHAHRGEKCHYVLAGTGEHYLQVVCDALDRLGGRFGGRR